MLTLPPTYEPIGQVLTPEEYDALPENPRRELVDGEVQVMATPTPWHQDVVDALKAALVSLAPSNMRVTREIEVRLSPVLRRNPDVLVVRAEGFSRRVPSLRPAQVVIALEVVSPGSESRDREVKPREYGSAGIEHYWRVETEPEIVVHTFRLGDHSTYVPTGVYTNGDTIRAPGLGWAKVAIADLYEEAR